MNAEKQRQQANRLIDEAKAAGFEARLTRQTLDIQAVEAVPRRDNGIARQMAYLWRLNMGLLNMRPLPGAKREGDHAAR